MRKCGDVGQRLQTLNYKMNTFWGLMYSMVIIADSTVIMYLKFAKRIDLKCSYHKEEMVIMWGDGDFN